MNGPDKIDLKELDKDDDIDNLDIKPKVKPITEFLTKPISQKNKSNQIAESIIEGQSFWHERQRNGVKNMINQFKSINDMIKDKSLKFDYFDLNDFVN